MAQITRGQILAHQRSVSPVDVDQFPKYDAAHVEAYCLCTAISIKGLYILRVPSEESDSTYFFHSLLLSWLFCFSCTFEFFIANFQDVNE